MAIKLQVQEQLGGRSGFADAAPVQRAVGTFGNVGLQAVNLPGEDVGGNISAILRAGQAQQAAYQEVSSGIDNIATTIENMAKAEDDTKFQSSIADFHSKSDEVRLRNLDRASKGEITYSQMADENKKELSDLSSQLASEANFNYGESRDTLSYKMRDNIESGYVSDAKVGIEKIAEQKKQGFRLEIERMGDDIRKNGAAGFKRAQDKMISYLAPGPDGKPSHPMVTIYGADNLQAMVLDVVGPAVDTNISNEILAHPEKALEAIDQGLWDGMLARKSPAEIDIIKATAEQQIVKKQNAVEDAFDKSSAELTGNVISKIEREGPINELEINNLKSSLSYKDYNAILNKNDEYKGISESSRKNYSSAKYSLEIGVNPKALSKEQKEELIKRDPYYGKAFTSQEEAITALKDQKNRLGIVSPDIINYVTTPPTTDVEPTKQQSWAKNTNSLEKSLPEEYNQLPEQTRRASLLMEKNNLTYDQAITRLQDIKSGKMVEENIPNIGEVKKSSQWTDPAETMKSNLSDQIGTFDFGDIDFSVYDNQYRSNFMEEMQYTSDVEVAAKRAVSRLKLGFATDSSGNKYAIQHPPEKELASPDYLEFFKTDVETKVDQINQEMRSFYNTDEHRINNFKVVPAPDFEKNKTYYVIDQATGRIALDNKQQPISIPLDNEKYSRLDLEKRSAKVSEKQPLFGKHSLSTNPTFARLENKYPSTVGKYPNLLNATFAVESSSGTDTRDSSAGAVGPFQMIPSTFWDVVDKHKLFPGDTNANPRDIKYAAPAAAAYYDDLIGMGRKVAAKYKWYNPDGTLDDKKVLEFAIVAYNWGPGKTENHIAKNNGYLNLNNIKVSGQSPKDHLNKVLGKA